MNVAYLESAPRERHQYNFVNSFTFNPGDKVATLKARTLLAFYAEKKELRSEPHVSDGNNWIIHFGPKVTDEKLAEFKTFIPSKLSPIGLGVIDAVIAIEYEAQAAEQPAIIAVRDDPVVNAIFVNAFLDSSKRWLHKRPDELFKLTRALENGMNT